MPLDPLEITGGIAIGEGVGGAIAAVVEPQLQDLKNAQWAAHQKVPLGPAEAARLAAQEYTGVYNGPEDASFHGINGDRYLALKFLAATAPGTPELLELWRRGRIGEQLVRDGLKKSGLMDEFVDAVLELFTGRLDPAVIATAIQRGIMADPGFLPVGPPATEGKVSKFPVSPLDAIVEAQAHGIDKERLFVETAIVGLPMALDQAAQATFRQIIERVDFDRAVSEGNTRNEWRDAIFETARQILTANQYAELRLRGWITDAQMYAGTALHGMSREATDLLHELLGRPIPVHQVTTGEARGGVFGGATDAIPEAFLRSLEEGNLRPEWYNLAYANRYTYPSAFVLRSITQGGEITQTQAHDALLAIGWPPSLAETVSTAWASSRGGAGKQLVKSELMDEFESGYISESELRDHLTALGYTGTELELEVHLGDARRIKAWRGKAETAINKAFLKGVVDAPTAEADLLALGLDQDYIDRVMVIWQLEARL